MRLIFAGTPDVAVASLRQLHNAGHEIALVLTRTDAPVGRKRALCASPVAVAAAELDLPVLKANRIGPLEVEQLRAAKAELGVVVAYGALFRAETLGVTRRGWINLHFSLLPAWRGAAPLQRAVQAGDTALGVSVFQLDHGMDSGPLWLQRSFSADPDAIASELLADFAERGAPLLLESIELIASGASPQPQRGEASFARKFDASEGQLRPEESAAESFNRYRAVSTEPGAYLELPDGRLKLHKVRRPTPSGEALVLQPGALEVLGGALYWGAADGVLELERVQPAGKTQMSALDWWRGRR